MERRDCPACVVFVEGTTLHALGDPNENQIEIVLLETGDIQVTCERGTPQIFRERIDAVRVRTGGGNDLVRYRIIDPSNPNQTIDLAHQPTSVEIDLGPGNNTAELLHLRLGRAAYNFALNGGAGNDTLLVSGLKVSGSLSFTMLGEAGNDSLIISDEEFLGGPDTRILMDGGTGHDSIITHGVNTLGDTLGTLLAGSGNDVLLVRDMTSANNLAIQIDTGGGNDAFNVSSLSAVDSLTMTFTGSGLIQSDSFSAGSVQLIATFTDSTSFQFTGLFSTRGNADIQIDGSRGDDIVHFADVAVADSLTTTISMGFGKNTVVISDVVSESDLTIALTDTGLASHDIFLVTNVGTSGNALIGLDGGAGNDTLSVSTVEVGGDLILHMEGGSGTDKLVVGNIQVAGDLTAFMFGGDGNDEMQAVDWETSGTLALTMFGGGGNDTMTAASLTSEGLGVDVLIDGGAGDDLIFVYNIISFELFGSTSIKMDGGINNDFIEVGGEIYGSMDVDVQFFGGTGNDGLRLITKQVASGVGLTNIFLDGGPGFDTAWVPLAISGAFMFIVGCEQVIEF